MVLLVSGVGNVAGRGVLLRKVRYTYWISVAIREGIFGLVIYEHMLLVIDHFFFWRDRKIMHLVCKAHMHI